MSINDWGDVDLNDVEPTPISNEGFADSKPTSSEPELQYSSVQDFFENFFQHIYKRKIDAKTKLWPGDWWNYPEALLRMDAIWRSYEALRQDPATGISVWLRDHADYHMGVLLSPDGPFNGSKPDDENINRKGEPLPHTAPPENMFIDANELN